MDAPPWTIAHVDAERGFSGGEVQLFLLMEGLRERGHRCLLLCPPGSRAAEHARSRGIEVRAVPMRSDLDAPAVLRLARALREAPVDLVHLHTGRATWLGGLAARLARRPAVATRRMDRRVRRGARTRWTYRRLVRRVVAISPAVGERLAQAGIESRLIASSVDPQRYALSADESARARGELRAELGAGADEPVALTLCELVPRKGVDVLLDAAAQAPALHLWIAGEGPERARLEARARELGLGARARFLGRRDDAPELLAAADLFVLPSHAEGLGVAALEAMAAGRAVVASRVGGLAEAVADGECGLLVEPGDAAALAAALERLAQGAELRARMGAAGRARVLAAYSAPRMVEAYLALYAEVLAEGAR